jgi:hypothetical protein
MTIEEVLKEPNSSEEVPQLLNFLAPQVIFTPTPMWSATGPLATTVPDVKGKRPR